jgi:hypothetical protein
MAKILVGGVGRTEVADTVCGLGLDDVQVAVSNDMDAALPLRAGRPGHYYLGTCHTGAGAALGVLVGLVGAARCHTFGRSVPSRQEVDALLDQGKTVFGFSVDQIDTVSPLVARAIAARR